jgi:hypothetical protein
VSRALLSERIARVGSATGGAGKPVSRGSRRSAYAGRSAPGEPHKEEQQQEELSNAVPCQCRLSVKHDFEGGT